MFSTYVAMLDNKETLENLYIKTRSNIVNTYREIILLHLLLIEISYRFKITIEFSLIFVIRDALLKHIL